MTVVPADELAGGMAADQILSRYPKPSVAFGTVCENDDIVYVSKLVKLDIPSDLNVPKEANVWAKRDALEYCRDRLDLRMVGGNASAYEPERCRKFVDDVDCDG